MADTNKVELSVVKETTPGTKETAEYLNVPFNSSTDLGLTPEYVQSTQINSNRASGENIQVGQTVEGGFDLDIQNTSNSDADSGVAGPNPIDEMLGAVIGSDAPVDGTANYDVEQGTLTCTGNGSVAGETAQLSGGLALNDLVYAYNPDTGLSSVAQCRNTSSLAFRCLPPFATDAKNSIVGGFTHRAGSDDVSFSIHREYTDVSQHEFLTGMRVNTFSLSSGADSIVTGNLGFLGTGHEYTGTNGTTKASTQPAYDGAMSSVGTSVTIQPHASGVASAAFSLGANGNFVTDLSVDIGANMRERRALGSIAPVGLGQGTIEATGSLTCYFADRSMVELVLSGQQCSMSIVVDNGTSAYGVYLPSVVFTQGSPSISGQNEDVLVEMSFNSQKAIGLPANEEQIISIGSFPYAYSS